MTIDRTDQTVITEEPTTPGAASDRMAVVLD